MIDLVSDPIARPPRLAAALLCAALAACSGGEPEPPASTVGPVPAEPQRPGDPQAGFRALTERGYVGCGIPYSAYSQVFGPAPAHLRIPGREGPNAELPYNLTRFTTASGVDVVAPNCLQCHAELLDGELVIGLGNHTADYTEDMSSLVVLAGALVTDEREREELQRFADRIIAVSPYIVTRTVGVNPANSLAAALFAHRDRDTLAWSYQPLLELPPAEALPVDVPPWWHMRKKNAMFYLAAGRGDHARIMMTASTLCVDSVDEARAIDEYFPDVRAFITSLEPPAYPHPIDAGLAASGREVFERTCARCHGTYGEDGEYPNLVVALEEVGTDDTMVVGASQFAERFVDWFNDSFFGELARLAPAPGYLAPPLDGVWATAPYLHNGSVPTVEAVLDSSLRPTYFRRSLSGDYDPEAIGWRFTALDAGHDAIADREQRKLVYDTTLPGYSNRGHLFGDALSADERRAVLEYLKTL